MLNRSLRSPLKRSHWPRPARGFTLLEVLVAILILSFGVLGAAGMQIAALQSNKEARYQANAARLGRELTDLIRANSVIAATTTVPTATAGNPFLLDYVTSAIPSTVYSPTCMTPSTTTACGAPPSPDAAQWAVQSWINQLADPTNGLPSPKVRVCFDNTPFDSSGKMQWLCTGRTSTSPPTPMYIKLAWARTAINATSAASTAPLMESGASAPMLVMPILP